MAFSPFDIFFRVLPWFIYFIIAIKLAFVLSALAHAYYTNNSKSETKEHKKKAEKTLLWKEQSEFVFTICMAILLILIFHPRYGNINYLSHEIRLLFFLFGVILIVTANWGEFFHVSPLFQAARKAWN